jgi:hypothetical protein
LKSPKLVLYASYPKTGSTLLPNLIDRLGRKVSGSIVRRFEWGGGKNNFQISNHADQPLYLVKTHFNVEDLLKRLTKEPSDLAWLLDAIRKGDVDLLGGQGYGSIYILRNPFCVLVSAVDYSKQLFARADVRSKWAKSGKDRKFFVDLLGMDKVPEADVFSRFSLLDLSADKIEEIAWRYVQSNGSIPVFDAGDGVVALGYFGHVMYYAQLMLKLKSVACLTYEGLMSRNIAMLEQLANVLDMDSDELVSVWDAENIDRNKSAGRYGNVFYSGFRTSTPEQFRLLSSWPRLLEEIKVRCPPLAAVTY